MKKTDISKVLEMSKHAIELRIGVHVKELEKLGMSHEDACVFVSNIMNFGIGLDRNKSENKQEEAA